MAFNAPDEMQLGDTKTIQLLLSPLASEEELEQELTAIGSKEGAQINVSNRMQASLTGSGFQIETISPEEQFIDPEDTTEWQWDITPTKAGTQTLHLTLITLINVDGQEGTIYPKSFDQPIYVYVTWGQRLETIGGFITSNWQWFWTVILVPIVLWIYTRYKKNKKPYDKKQFTSTEPES